MDTCIDRVKHTVESVAEACGLTPANVCVGGTVKTGCRITNSGIDLLVNHEWCADVASRNRFGVRGRISPAETETMTACFVAMRAQDFFLEDWCPRITYEGGLTAQAQRYLQGSIDDLVAYARMITCIPFARSHFEAYLSRAAAHVMTSEPLHLQLMRAVRLYLFENNPQLAVSPLVLEELGTTVAMKPLVADLKRIVFDEELSYRERHTRAARLLVEPLTRMVKRDEDTLSFYDLMHLYDKEQSYGTSKDAVEDENALRQEAALTERAHDSLAAVTEATIDQLIADNNLSPAGKAAAPNPSLPGMPTETGSMQLTDDHATSYEEATAQWHVTIEEVADVLVRIATPQEQLCVPRYDGRLSRSGSRLHPGAIVNAQMLLASGQEKPVWQKPRRCTRPQDLRFQGLDIFLLLDASISMTGDKAKHAAAMAVCLIEGIDRAVELVTHSQRSTTVDIRTQVLAFGEGWAELTPLETTHEQSRKQLAYTQLLNPASEQTLVAGALEQVREQALENHERTVLCLVVSDGLFADGLQARKTALHLPDNVHLAHINIGDYASLPLSEHFETITNPTHLPEKLHTTLLHQLQD